MPHWSIVASGLAIGEDIIASLKRGLGVLGALPGVSNVITSVEATDHGWSLSASGDAGTPDDHALVLSHVTGLLASPALETGTSEINSPFVAAQNFHTAPAADTPVPVEGAGDAGTGPA